MHTTLTAAHPYQARSTCDSLPRKPLTSPSISIHSADPPKMTVVARQYYNNVCYNSNGTAYRCYSGWYSWGRWVALGVIIAAALLIFFLISCLSARRRRRLGRQPYYGTGWAGRTPWGHAPASYNPGYQTQQQQPPNYNQNNGGYYGQNQGYFGGRQTDVEMTPPPNTYRGGDNVYEPPPGPPPAKK